MKIPKYVEYALKMRCNLACKLDNVCKIVDKFIDENDIEVDYEDYHGGVEIYVNPHESCERIKEAIENK